MNRIEGTLNERQTKISQRVGALLNGRVFAPEVTEHLEEASARARDPLKMLDAEDIPAAREPASAAARALQLALDAMNKAGEEEAEDKLTDAMRALNNAAAQAQNAPQQTSAEAAKAQADEAANAVEETSQKLRKAAQAQQERGSAAAAKRLAGMANALNGKDLQDALQKAQGQARDRGAAEAAAEKLRALAEEADRKRRLRTLAVMVDHSDSMTGPDQRGETRLRNALKTWNRHTDEAARAFAKQDYYAFSTHLEAAEHFLFSNLNNTVAAISYALSGRGPFSVRIPRALPRAGMLQAVGLRLHLEIELPGLTQLSRAVGAWRPVRRTLGLRSPCSLRPRLACDGPSALQNSATNQPGTALSTSIFQDGYRLAAKFCTEIELPGGIAHGDHVIARRKRPCLFTRVPVAKIITWDTDGPAFARV
jgi:hypothetical protein